MAKVIDIGWGVNQVLNVLYENKDMIKHMFVVVQQHDDEFYSVESNVPMPTLLMAREIIQDEIIEAKEPRIEVVLDDETDEG